VKAMVQFVVRPSVHTLANYFNSMPGGQNKYVRTAAIAVVSYYTFGAVAGAVQASMEATAGACFAEMPFTASVVGWTAAGASAGAVSTALNGGSTNEVLRAGLRGGVTGAASAALFYGANSLARDWNAVGRIAARSTASGLAAEINGGDFQDGFRLGFTTSTTSWAYRQVVGYDATWRQGGSAVPKESLSYPVEGANNIGTVTQEVRSNAWWSEGGIVSRALNVVPGVNAVAGMHDVFQIKLEQWGGGLSRNVLNIPGMPIAAYLTGGALTDELLPLAYANGFRAR